MTGQRHMCVSSARGMWSEAQLNAVRSKCTSMSCCRRQWVAALLLFVGMDEHGASMAIFMAQVCTRLIADSACRRYDCARSFQSIACRFGTYGDTNTSYLVV